jgi:hypothetical protein
MLPYWEPDVTLAAEARQEWCTRAYRVALGVELVAHLEPIVDEDRLLVGFCVRSSELAGMLVEAILRENVGARVARAHPGMEQEDACDVVLTCRPDAPEEEVKHAVVASTKAAHTYLCARPAA